MRGIFRKRRLSPAALVLAVAVALKVLSCSPAGPRAPNVLWIVWDTARADRMSLYGHSRDTTPFLREWAAGARVFEDCLSAAGNTLPSHASMFTGLLPGEHCTDNVRTRLDDGHTTIAELLQQAGYRTYLYSANPHISGSGNFDQGFDLAEHPWSSQYADRALEIVRGKLPEYDRSSELRGRLEAARRGAGGLTEWNIKASGELAQEATLAWLENSPRGKPFFVFLNYMEAHRPYIPPRSFREQLMTAEDVEASYAVDRSWQTMWEYTFRLRDYDDREIELTRATYDATLLELDAMLNALLKSLDERGYLENTVVILTSDHGEHLGEQHMFDHQYSLYQPVLQVPLVVHYPPRFAPGREERPVMNYDLFPTILELAGLAPPEGLVLRCRSLLRPEAVRTRFAEDPNYARLGIDMVKRQHPDWDPRLWQRGLRSFVEGEAKLIWGTDGRAELFDLSQDPLETKDLRGERETAAGEMQRKLDEYHAGLAKCVTYPAR